jgi:uncharacterized short protein YbdD (DUF466 family)
MKGLLTGAISRSAQAGRGTGRYLATTLRLMVGVPDYETYLNHMRVNHPDQKPMEYAEFFRERQRARYGGKGRIACC